MRAQKAEEIAKLAVERVEKEAFDHELNRLYDEYGYSELVENIQETVNNAITSIWAKIKSVFKK